MRANAQRFPAIQNRVGWAWHPLHPCPVATRKCVADDPHSGWPGSIVEFYKVIEPLLNPSAFGGDAKDAFHVVIPSLPGFGFSDEPTEPGWNVARIARAWDVLMKRLGYSRYVAQGGDWGAAVTTRLAEAKPEGLAATHLNFPIFIPTPLEGTPTEEEKAAIARASTFSISCRATPTSRRRVPRRSDARSQIRQLAKLPGSTTASSRPQIAPIIRSGC